ncbi:MAG: TlyA family RNA methyltransferase [Chloroflexi bacterium]|nr:TlyA family RNA methyltransferase [Chloroflexota bacterium]
MSRQPKHLRGTVRLDLLLVERGLASTEQQARALVQEGAVQMDGRTLEMPGVLVPRAAEITVRQGPAYASRGGLKLAGALDALGFDPTGTVAADIGASTGGFTDCLLQRGAARVYAVDVGYGQIAWRLRQDPRVVVLERTNARHPVPISEPLGLVTIDVSFISLMLVLPNAAALLAPGGRILALVKPQFEAGRAEVGRGGVVQDPLVRARAVGKVCLWAIGQGLRLRGVVPSALLGPKGNREVFVLLEKPAMARASDTGGPAHPRC